jgi:hypothetical protein
MEYPPTGDNQNAKPNAIRAIIGINKPKIIKIMVATRFKVLIPWMSI